MSLNVDLIVFVFCILYFAFCILYFVFCICVAALQGPGKVRVSLDGSIVNFTRILERILPFRLTPGIFHLTAQPGCTLSRYVFVFVTRVLFGKLLQ